MADVVTVGVCRYREAGRCTNVGLIFGGGGSFARRRRVSRLGDCDFFAPFLARSGFILLLYLPGKLLGWQL